MVITKKDYAEKNTAAINDFLADHEKAVEFINSHPDERGKIVNNQLKLITNKEIPIRGIGDCISSYPSYAND